MQLSTEDDKAIRAHVTQYLDSVNNRAPGVAASHFHSVVGSTFHDTDGALFTGAAGTSVGQAAIAKRFTEMYSGRFKDAKITMRINNIQQVSPDVAIVGSTCLAAGIKRTNGEAVAPLESNSIITLVKANGAWKIAAQAVVNKTAA